MYNLKTEYVDKKIIYYEKIDSTQKEAWRNIDSLENGTLIVADVQTDAIGTHGRIWYTSERNNIAFSLVLFPNMDVRKLDNFTIEIAEIILEVLGNLYNIRLDIKYPNDIVINSKKIGGILTETKLQGNIIKKLVIGVGLNTNQQKFVKEIADVATSIKKEFNIEINNRKVISEFCNIFEKRYNKRRKL